MSLTKEKKEFVNWCEFAKHEVLAAADELTVVTDLAKEVKLTPQELGNHFFDHVPIASKVASFKAGDMESVRDIRRLFWRWCLVSHRKESENVDV